MRILCIEDDPATALSIALMLESEGMSVQTTEEGEEGLYLGRTFDYDIILVDLNLPDMSGYDVLKTLRVAKIATPVIILSGLAGIEDIVKGLGFGADDYMTKPFHKDELVARILAVVRRSSGFPSNTAVAGPLSVDLHERIAALNGEPVHVTRKEYDLLELLVLNHGRITTREAVMNHLYGGMDEPDPKIVDVFVYRLRANLHSDGLIETVWGRGWRLAHCHDDQARRKAIAH